MPSPETIGQEHQPAQNENPAAKKTEAALVNYCQTHVDHPAARAVLNARNKEAARFGLPIRTRDFWLLLVIFGVYRGLDKLHLNFAPYCGFWGIPTHRGEWGACQFGVTDPQWWYYRRYIQDTQFHTMAHFALGIAFLAAMGVSATFIKYATLTYYPASGFLYAFIRFSFPYAYVSELWVPIVVHALMMTVASAKGTTPGHGWAMNLIFQPIYTIFMLLTGGLSTITIGFPPLLQATALQILRLIIISTWGVFWRGMFCCMPNFHPYVFQITLRWMFVGVPDCLILFAYFASSNRSAMVLTLLWNFIIFQMCEINYRNNVMKSFFHKITKQSNVPSWEKPYNAARVASRVHGLYSCFLVFIPIGGFLLGRGIRYDWQKVAWQIPKYPAFAWEGRSAIPWSAIKELRFDTWQIYVCMFVFILQAFTADYVNTWIQRQRHSCGAESFMETHDRMQIPGEILPFFKSEHTIIPEVMSPVIPDAVIYYIWGDRIPVTWIFISVMWDSLFVNTFFAVVAAGMGYLFF